MTTDARELLACPFCGSQPQRDTATGELFCFQHTDVLPEAIWNHRAPSEGRCPEGLQELAGRIACADAKGIARHVTTEDIRAMARFILSLSALPPPPDRPAPPAETAGWIPVTERLPERNRTVVYWHKPYSSHGIQENGPGYFSIADEWRDEDHLEAATHWLDVFPPRPAPVPDISDLIDEHSIGRPRSRRTP